MLKKLVPVSWKNPFVNSIFKLLDPVDYAIRSFRGISYLPLLSIRIRSNGVTNQFGGKTFLVLSEKLADLLKTYAFIDNKSNILEIGCGCGRTAFALVNYLETGSYTGMDIEKISLESCKKNKYLKEKGFKFDYLDIYNAEYNATSTTRADLYNFPYKANSFDNIFLISVFTHMMEKDIRNYIKEISRMLSNNGTCMLSTFLMDQGRKTNGFSFPHHTGESYYYNKTIPEVAVGYYLDFFKNEFKKHKMVLVEDPLFGTWRNINTVKSYTNFSQDLLIFKKTTTR